MSNGNYPSPAVAYQGVHALIGYGAVLTAAFRLHHWMYGFVAVLVFALPSWLTLIVVYTQNPRPEVNE